MHQELNSTESMDNIIKFLWAHRYWSKEVIITSIDILMSDQNVNECTQNLIHSSGPMVNLRDLFWLHGYYPMEAKISAMHVIMYFGIRQSFSNVA